MQLENYLKNNFNLSFSDLYEREGLIKLNQKFEDFLAQKDAKIAADFSALKNNIAGFSDLQKSEILINISRILEEFLSLIFNIEKENLDLKKRHQNLQELILVRRDFIQRNIAKKFTSAPEGFDGISF